MFEINSQLNLCHLCHRVLHYKCGKGPGNVCVASNMYFEKTYDFLKTLNLFLANIPIWHPLKTSGFL